MFFPLLSTFLSKQPSATEKVDWFPECTTEIPDSDELREWLILGQVNIKNPSLRYTVFTWVNSCVPYLSSLAFYCL